MDNLNNSRREYTTKQMTDKYVEVEQAPKELIKSINQLKENHPKKYSSFLSYVPIDPESLQL